MKGAWAGAGFLALVVGVGVLLLAVLQPALVQEQVLVLSWLLSGSSACALLQQVCPHVLLKHGQQPHTVRVHHAGNAFAELLRLLEAGCACSGAAAEVSCWGCLETPFGA